jgi:hypothetical protein
MKTITVAKRLILALCICALSAGMGAAAPRDGRPLIQIALLLDTSNSMDGLINQEKSQLWKIVGEAGKMTRNGQRAMLEVALYEYGNDSISSLSGYVRRVMPFTSDLDALSACLFELDTNGGSEYCGLVIKKSLDELGWSNHDADLRLVYIAGNEPFNQGSFDFRDAGKRAVRSGIVVNTIYCGSRDDGVSTYWAEGARITGGTYASINGDYEYEYIPCPQDDRLSELNLRLNDTYVAFGTLGESRKELQLEQDSRTEELNKSSFYERAKVKSSASYSNSTWDLVDATSSGAMPLASVKESELPEEMRGMSEAQKKAYIDRKLAERKEIQSEIAALSAERDAWLAVQQSTTKADGALDTAILAPLSSLAKGKGFVPAE